MNDVIWFVFIKPYVSFQGEWVPSDAPAKVPALCAPCESDCPVYSTLQGGDLWSIYNDQRNGNSSYEVIRELALEIMTKYGYKLDHIRIFCEMNKDAMIRP